MKYSTRFFGLLYLMIALSTPLLVGMEEIDETISYPRTNSYVQRHRAVTFTESEIEFLHAVEKNNKKAVKDNFKNIPLQHDVFILASLIADDLGYTEMKHILNTMVRQRFNVRD